MEQLTGPFDGVTTEFSLAKPHVAGSVRVFWPTLQQEAAVTDLGATIELGEAPQAGDAVYVFYQAVT